jgi:hypothetical protein
MGVPTESVLAAAGFAGHEQMSMYWSERFTITVSDAQLEEFKRVLLPCLEAFRAAVAKVR